METTKLRRFAQYARRTLLELVEARLQLVLQVGSAARRENAEAIKTLEEAINSHSEAQVVERVAYTWFNRFCALRFMDVNRYTRIGVVSPAEGQFQPEILAEAKMGHIDEETVPEKIRQQILALLGGNAPSHDPQGEAYRLLVVAACNAWHKAMPFLFERIDDYTELLMPDDLLSGNSILAYTREAMTPDACVDVEVIGWLYQFYISEKKDSVFEGLKKNQKVTPENIPAATQLFTPHWIVRYLVENSLGRLWLLNHPSSKLAEQMEYYVAPEQPETDFLKIASPEEIKICDPACGSGHMLTYAFDLLYAIYEEDGVDPAEIPEKILTYNLYGVEIDERAGELAAFALTMKARAKQRRFFNKGIKPNICVLENVNFAADELAEYMSFVGRDLLTAPLQATLRQFEEADNFGSLIRPDVTDVAEVLRLLAAKDVAGQLFLSETHRKVMRALRQADYLSPRYHVVVANPPYMGSAGMNPTLKGFAAKHYKVSKGDLFSMFIERSFELSRPHGYIAMITLQNWMFLSSYEAIRSEVLKSAPIKSLVQVGFNSFPELNSKFALGAAFVLQLQGTAKVSEYINLNDAPHSSNKQEVFLERKRSGKIFRVNPRQFLNIPGSPIQYSLSQDVFHAFEKNPKFGELVNARNGMTTGDNESFVRRWTEVSFSRIAISSLTDANTSNARWFPYNKGGQTRKWYGNQEMIVDWRTDGYAIKAIKPKSTPRNTDFFFRESVSWSDINIKNPSFRFYDNSFCFDAAVNSAFPKDRSELLRILSASNNCFVSWMAPILNPTMHFKIGDFSALPAVFRTDDRVEQEMEAVLAIARADWDSSETSWNFTSLALLHPDYRQPTLKAIYQKLRTHWCEITLETQRLEQENNRIFIEAYGLQRELVPEVPIREITLTCNPHYRYGGIKTDDDLEALLLADTIRELVSYAVGCMFGRYSLDKPGLVLANQGETIEDYLKQVPEPSFVADDDNVIPMLDGDWFTDDITERFRKFLRVVFGEEHFEENLRFIELALGKNGNARSIQEYFLKDFYTDHVKRYKKRPIYWLFSSPNGTFNVLIYMHRYRPDTASVALNGYLRDFRKKLAAHLDYQQQVGISTSASQGEKTRALNEIETLKKQLLELDDYERDTLYPLAIEQVVLDLDDGVKVNYLKLGSALKKINGLDAKED